MKKIIISLILFLVCLGGAAASFTFYDAAAYNDWMVQARSQIEQSAPGLFHKDAKPHRDEKKKHKDEKHKDEIPQDKEGRETPRVTPQDKPVPAEGHPAQAPGGPPAPGPQTPGPQGQGSPAPNPDQSPDRNAR